MADVSQPEATPDDENAITEEQFWTEDAARVNELCDQADAAGATVGTVHDPPKLNPDGSLAEQSDAGALSPYNSRMSPLALQIRKAITALGGHASSGRIQWRLRQWGIRINQHDVLKALAVPDFQLSDRGWANTLQQTTLLEESNAA